jgi:acyl carrier protein
MSKLTHIFASVLGVEESGITNELSPENTETWDSLNAIILLTEIEKAFDTRFEYDEAMNIKCFGDVIALVESRGKNAHE